MKRTLVAAILGLATVGAAYGQGHLLISNYLNPPYSQVYWGWGTDPGGIQP